METVPLGSSFSGQAFLLMAPLPLVILLAAATSVILPICLFIKLGKGERTKVLIALSINDYNTTLLDTQGLTLKNNLTCVHLLTTFTIVLIGILLLASALLCTKFANDLSFTFFLKGVYVLNMHSLLLTALSVGCLGASRWWDKAWLRVLVLALAGSTIAFSFYETNYITRFVCILHMGKGGMPDIYLYWGLFRGQKQKIRYPLILFLSSLTQTIWSF